jgi:hypothetical protein
MREGLRSISAGVRVGGFARYVKSCVHAVSVAASVDAAPLVGTSYDSLRMAGRRWFSVLALAAVLPACDSANEVVAVKMDGVPEQDAAPRFNEAEIIHGCQAGHYKGYFRSDTAEGGVTVFAGEINFELVLTPSKEFLELARNSTLEGVSPGPPQATFEAVIVGTRPCEQGHIASNLENGALRFQGVDNVIDFSGRVDGYYLLPPELEADTGPRVPGVFSGRWSAGVMLPVEGGEEYTPVYQGSWFASLSGR